MDEPKPVAATILIVEDSPVNQRILARLLKDAGYRVQMVSNGMEALAHLATAQPDLILLDVMMPEMDGFELCRQLQQRNLVVDVPIIFISSLDDAADKVSGFAAGGVDYITKPFHPAEVLARIDTHLKLCRLQRQLAERNRQLALEKQKSEALLRNVLPVTVAAELLERGTCTPQSFPDVTVCFVDLVGFTPVSSSLAPDRLINELNELFTAFDHIVEYNHCERIKTTGDAYLYVSGITKANADHTRDVALAALDMVDYLTLRNRTAEYKWQIRIGIHTGSVIGGIVGVKKYLYDIFGDTVNIAARLQALSHPMCIHVSDAVYQRLKDAFLFSCPLDVEMKGKGKQSTCFLEARASSSVTR